MEVGRALLSVSNKDGIIEFAKGLADLGVELIATGGTARLLGESGLDCTPVEDVTGFPEILAGRVKTLHPKILGGILARRAVDLEEIDAHGIGTIDLVAVNLYPFERAAFEERRTQADILEEIDIGGVTLIRAAAKNHPDVAVVTCPDRYPEILERLREGGAGLDEGFRRALAREEFHHTAGFDSVIARHFDVTAEADEGPGSREHFHLVYRRAQNLRYGENPHQAAAFYRDLRPDPLGVASAHQRHGRELSYNNILDLDAASGLAADLPKTGCAVIKHTNPCGVGIGDSPADAYRKALAADPVSAFGSIIAFNAPVDGEAAEEMRSLFVECVIAPGFSPEAIDILTAKKNLRILELPALGNGEETPADHDVRSVRGGLLVQERDRRIWDEGTLRCVTKREPSEAERRAIRLGWIVCRHIKSNGIVLAAEDRVIGIGTGQMSRIDSVEIALMKARQAGLDVRGSVMASDAFFPFRDGVDRVAGEGIRAVVQPGGSIRDEEVIAAADEHGIAMLFTGIRHFRH
jgi:phosphoribosylaminoimidazolecarboxamide formyltransferase/IMP cyclohydrolase